MPRRGSQHHLAKLTEDQVRRMRQQYAEGGTSYWKLALEYNLSSTDTVGKIINRVTWTHI